MVVWVWQVMVWSAWTELTPVGERCILRLPHASLPNPGPLYARPPRDSRPPCTPNDASSRPMPISCRWPFLAKFVTSYFVSTLSLPEHASKHYICIHGNTGRRASCGMYFLSCSTLQQQIHVCYNMAFQQVIIISFNLILSGGTCFIWKILSYP